MNSNLHQTSFYRTFEVSQKSKWPYSVLYSSIGIESNESGGVPIAMCHILRNLSKISPFGKYSFCFFGFSCFQIFHHSSQSFLWMSWNKNSICQHKRSYFFYSHKIGTPPEMVAWRDVPSASMIKWRWRNQPPGHLTAKHHLASHLMLHLHYQPVKQGVILSTFHFILKQFV